MLDALLRTVNRTYGTRSRAPNNVMQQEQGPIRTSALYIFLG